MIGKQPLFFVSTATADGRINLSPKGLDCFRVLGPRRLDGELAKARLDIAFGQVLFPGQTLEMSMAAYVPKSQIDELAVIGASNFFPMVIATITYEFYFAEGRHVTSTIFEIKDRSNLGPTIGQVLQPSELRVRPHFTGVHADADRCLQYRQDLASACGIARRRTCSAVPMPGPVRRSLCRRSTGCVRRVLPKRARLDRSCLGLIAHPHDIVPGCNARRQRLYRENSRLQGSARHASLGKTFSELSVSRTYARQVIMDSLKRKLQRNFRLSKVARDYQKPAPEATFNAAR
jgi:hypothetical protein